ncbi:MAG: hydantoinase B/oxoprolinase family protein [Myxococcota bacterium]
MSAPRWRFWIDRGGTFTDCLGVSPSGMHFVTKVLSSDEAPILAIKRVLKDAGDATALSELRAKVRLGTTVATNALLERRGVATALLTPKGLSGVFDIGTQERPALFDLEIERPAPLQRFRLEVKGRRDAQGEIVEALDEAEARRVLGAAREDGAESLAIAWMHAYAEPTEERRLAEIAREMGFAHVVASSEMSRESGFLSRGETAIADAYLTPLLRGHLDALAAALPEAELRFMQSSGGLTDQARFRGPGALLSGPAGGVVATRAVAEAAGYSQAIGFDMGGTSTDVSVVSSEGFDRVFESEVGGVRVKAPMLRIHTVAAGGGSLCRFDGFRLTVGPESAGSDPGPLCYAGGHGRDSAGGGGGRAAAPGELTVTDINLALGRVAPDRFPFALDASPVAHALDQMQASLAAAGFERTTEEIAAGFFEIANASMAQAITQVSVERGADPRAHVLVGFGGAGGQHVCAIAKRLGIQEILLHPYAGLLSAFGIGLASLSWDGERDGGGLLLSGGVDGGDVEGGEPGREAEGDLPSSVSTAWAELREEALGALAAEGLREEGIQLERSLDLGYAGTDTALAVAEPADAAAGGSASGTAWRAAFESEHRLRFGYVREGRAVEIKAIRLRALGEEDAETSGLPDATRQKGSSLADATREPGRPTPLRMTSAWFPEAERVEAPVYAREDLVAGDRLEGPALILESTGTVVLDPGFGLTVDAGGVFRLRAQAAAGAAQAANLSEADPVRLEVLGNRFMSIAEQMGTVLRNTSVSTNIKERLDYSCAVFDGDGGLVANAPHIPVHLGAMADTVAALRARFEPFEDGDVLVTNDPFAGGSHLPDVTVVTPVFLSAVQGKEGPSSEGPARPAFFVASRGHHADLGGKTPGSMPADSTHLREEGILIDAFPLVRGGVFDEARIRAVLSEGPHPARRPDDNVADLESKVAANRAGAQLLRALAAEVGPSVVQVTMRQLQVGAAEKVARELAKLSQGEHVFEDALDDGTSIRVKLRVEHASVAERSTGALPARMDIDFDGSGPASSGNLNAPSAVVRAAVIYVLRSLVAERIPLNGGCLAPIALHIPQGSILDPPPGSAVVGGNVETSQRVVDVLLGALGRAAASQGTMNNVTFGDAEFGYYETIGGGAGATAQAEGASGVHTHMTNTRITDPEILEARFPVRLLEFGLRVGSGGGGERRGGDGIVRRYAFLRPVTVSLLTERRERAPFGLRGGEAGAVGRNRVLRNGRSEPETLPGRVAVSLERGDQLWIETPGGGGFGRHDEEA